MSNIPDYCAFLNRRAAARSDLADRIVFWVVMIIAGYFLTNCTPSPAAELILHGPSVHFESGHNNANFGVGYVSDNRWAAGAYQNSLGKLTVYGGKVFNIAGDFHVLVGAATGYNAMPIQPAAVLIYTVPLDKNWRLHVNAVPVNGGVLNLAAGYVWK